MLSNFLLNAPVSDAYSAFKLVLIALIFICSIALIVLIMRQSGNSSGIGALGGSSETFLSKNKSKTKESLNKKRTIFFAVLLGVLLIGFAILSVFPF